jgi:hypothetical protein
MLADLVASAGAQARIVDGTLPECLIAVSTALGQSGPLVKPAFDVEMEFPGIRRASLPSQVHEAWARSIAQFVRRWCWPRSRGPPVG